MALLDIGGHAADVASLGVDLDVEDRHQVDVVDLDGAGRCGGTWPGCDSLTGVDCLAAGGLDVEHVVQLHGRVVRILHGHEILVAGLDVDPEIAVDGDAGVQGGHRLLDDFLGRQAHARPPSGDPRR